MYGGRTDYVVLWTHFFRIHLRQVKRFYDVYWMSLSAKSTFKIMNLGGYVFRIVFFFKLSNNDDEKYSKNSVVN